MNFLKSGFGDPLQEYTGTFRFWLSPGKGANVVFLDDEPQRFLEHNIQISGKWGNTFVCRMNLVEDDPDVRCPLCEAGDRPSEVGALTIIDRTEWTGKKGNSGKDTKKLYMATRKTQNALEWWKEQLGGSFKNHEFAVFRNEKTDPRVGNQFNHIGVIDLEKTFPDKKEPEDLLIFPYEEMFTAPTMAEMNAVVKKLNFKPDYENEKPVSY